MRKFKFLMGTVRNLLGGLLLFSILFVVSCDNGGDDPEPELYDFKGVYTFKSAILQSELAIPGFDLFSYKAGDDITSLMKGGLLAEAPCKDADNGAVELKEADKLFFVCIGEDDEKDAGSWSATSDQTKLTLTVNTPAGVLPMAIEELEIDRNNDVIGGTIKQFPITAELLSGFLTPQPPILTQQMIDGILAGITNPIFVDLDIEFQKVSE